MKYKLFRSPGDLDKSVLKHGYRRARPRSPG